MYKHIKQRSNTNRGNFLSAGSSIDKKIRVLHKPHDCME